VLLNKTYLASETQCAEAKALILRANPAARIRCTQFGHFELEWLSLLVPDVDKVLDWLDTTPQKRYCSFASRCRLQRCRKVSHSLRGSLAHQSLCPHPGGIVLRRLHWAVVQW
jgi:hypothetical protein